MRALETWERVVKKKTTRSGNHWSQENRKKSKKQTAPLQGAFLPLAHPPHPVPPPPRDSVCPHVSWVAADEVRGAPRGLEDAPPSQVRFSFLSFLDPCRWLWGFTSDQNSGWGSGLEGVGSCHRMIILTAKSGVFWGSPLSPTFLLCLLKVFSLPALGCCC